VFDVPLPLAALIRTTQPDASIARALLVKNNAVIEAARQLAMLLVLPRARGIAVDSAASAWIRLDLPACRGAVEP
jgi:hypothetical protein